MDQDYEYMLNEDDELFINKQMEKPMEPNKNDSALTFSLINGNPGLVIRADTTEQMDALVDKAIVSFNRFKSSLAITPQATVAISTAQTPAKEYDVADNAMCPVHNVTMTHYENAKGEWWSHKIGEKEWCNGRKTKYNGYKK